MSHVVSVSKSSSHTFSKEPVNEICLIEGQGVEGDAHKGVTVKHRSRVKADPTQPNLRQVHLIHVELIYELQGKGFQVQPATMGENITTEGIDLLSLPRDTLLRIGPEAVVRVTGLRNPCKQLNTFQDGLMQAVLDKDAEGNLIRKAGIMSVVVAGGPVKPGDDIEAILPSSPFEKLERV
ncbi:MAG: MOSC domain-containing protein [Cyanobacteria bacterium P01_F01_bin.150]